MKHDQILNLDPLVHAPIRLAVLSLLITVESANFIFLKESIGTTDGNLSTHLTKLEESAYISIKKTFKGKKPQTICAITRKGREALQSYLEQLEQIIHLQKKSKPY
jgi:DNA-binding HxlR family transcriptional regulator